MATGNSVAIAVAAVIFVALVFYLVWSGHAIALIRSRKPPGSAEYGLERALWLKKTGRMGEGAKILKDMSLRSMMRVQRKMNSVRRRKGAEPSAERRGERE
jgi:hypothetical protein